MNKIFVLILAVLFSLNLNAQKYFTKTGKVSFTSKSSKELIAASNSKASSVIDMSTGNIEWAVLIKAFSFDKALMQEHFNENYMESGKYPKSVFKGKINNPASVNLSKDGTYTADVSGKLEMHGVSKSINSKATFAVKSGKIVATSSLKILLADYKIDVPSVVRENIAKEILINIEANYEPIK